MACFKKRLAALLALLLLLICYSAASAQQKTMIVRMSEIEIEPAYLGEYRAILKEESATSVRLESGVISIFPMFEKEKPTQVRILEIYASREAYESHLKTAHFLRYKTTTLKMVKSLRLVDMGNDRPRNYANDIQEDEWKGMTMANQRFTPKDLERTNLIMLPMRVGILKSADVRKALPYALSRKI